MQLFLGQLAFTAVYVTATSNFGNERFDGGATIIQYPPAEHGNPSKLAGDKRKRIFIYDLPTQYNEELLAANPDCASDTNKQVYTAETAIWRTMLTHPNRVSNPDEADYFFVPFLASCYQRTLMLEPYNFSFWKAWEATYDTALDIVEIIRSDLPYWHSHGGKKHIWMFTDDVGGCAAPYDEIAANSILLVHEAEAFQSSKAWIDHLLQTDQLRVSTSASKSKSLNIASKSKNAASKIAASKSTTSFVDVGGGAAPSALLSVPHEKGIAEEFPSKALLRYEHPCYDSSKDIVIPPRVTISSHSVKYFSEKTHLAFFQGTVGRVGEDLRYSRGVRQRLFQLYGSLDTRENSSGKVFSANANGIAVFGPDKNHSFGDGQHTNGYLTEMASSTFCIAPRGYASWSPRLSEAVAVGCIPVIIADNLTLPFEPFVSYNEFSVSIKEADIGHLEKSLQEISQQQIQAMQEKLNAVRHYFTYEKNVHDNAFEAIIKLLQ